MRVLTQAWETGIPLACAASWLVETRAVVGTIHFAKLLRKHSSVGEGHSDPHACNSTYRPAEETSHYSEQ